MASNFNFFSFLNFFNFSFFSLLGVLYFHENLFGHHSFRQSQTALSVTWLIKDNTVVDYLPVFGAPWRLPMEYPFFQIIVANISKSFSFSHTLIAKLLNLVITLLSLVLLRKLLPNNAKTIHFSLIFSCPIVFYYSASYLIEATCLLLVICIFLILEIENNKTKNH